MVVVTADIDDMSVTPKVFERASIRLEGFKLTRVQGRSSATSGPNYRIYASATKT